MHAMHTAMLKVCNKQAVHCMHCRVCPVLHQQYVRDKLRARVLCNQLCEPELRQVLTGMPVLQSQLDHVYLMQRGVQPAQ